MKRLKLYENDFCHFRAIAPDVKTLTVIITLKV